MIYFLALLPATALTIAGYLVLYFANSSQGTFKKAGQVLAIWSFALAGLVILGAIFAAAHNGGRGRFPMRGGPAFMGPGGPGPGARFYRFRQFDGPPPVGGSAPLQETPAAPPPEAAPKPAA